MAAHPELRSLIESLDFYTEWLNWSMENCYQRGATVTWRNYPDGTPPYFEAEFVPRPSYARDLEADDILMLKFHDKNDRLQEFKGIVSTLKPVEPGNQEIEQPIGQETIKIHFHQRKEQSFHHHIPSSEHSDDVDIIKSPLYHSFFIQYKNILKIKEHVTKKNNHLGDYLRKILDPERRFSEEKPLDAYMNSRCSYRDESGRKLNESQKIVIDYALKHGLTLVQGPPGTGKTFTSAILAHHLFETRLNKKNHSKILICSSSNVAVDNLALKIHEMGEMNVVRIRSLRAKDVDTTKLSKSLYLDKLMMAAEGDKFDEYRRLLKIERIQLSRFFRLHKSFKLKRLERSCERIFLDKANVICSTCVGSAKAAISDSKYIFDSLIIDECSQVTVPESLLPIFYAPKRIILVGDEKQLGPVIHQELGGRYTVENIVLYNRLIYQNQGHLRPLLMDTQYRMHPQLSEFPNKYFYEGRIKNGIGPSDRAWRYNPNDCPFPDAAKPLCFYHHNYPEETHSGSTSTINVHESQFVVEVIEELLSMGVLGQNIGVITPYYDQCKFISKNLSELRKKRNRNKRKNKKKATKCPDKTLEFNNIEVNTVDAYQGREKDYIIVSLVRSADSHVNLDFVADERRLNVTLTRARFGMFIFGNEDTLLRATEERNEKLPKLIQDLSDRDLIIDW